MFTDLKLFQWYSSVKQWTEDDWRVIIHQIVSVIVSLLAYCASAAVHFIQTVMNFVILTQYISHNENTLQYLKHTLFQINKLKNVFQHLHSVDSDITESHFNILKLHIMTHYTYHIHWYDTADNVDTEHSEITHKFLIKIFFNWINKCESFQEQLLLHNTHHLNLTVMKNLIVWRKTQHSVINKNIVIMTQSSWVISLCKISDLSLQKERDQIQCESLNSQKWCSAATLNVTLNMSEFLDALTVFVHNCWNKADEIESTDNALNCRSKNSLSVASYYVCIHRSLKYWKQGENTLQNLEKWVEERVYCISDWQRRRDLWRHNCILIQQQSEDTETAFSALRDWLSDRLQIIISVKDSL